MAAKWVLDFLLGNFANNIFIDNITSMESLHYSETKSNQKQLLFDPENPLALTIQVNQHPPLQSQPEAPSNNIIRQQSNHHPQYSASQRSQKLQSQRINGNHFLTSQQSKQVPSLNEDSQKKYRPQSSVSRDCWTQINQFRAMKAQWQADKQLLIEEEHIHQGNTKLHKLRRQLKGMPDSHRKNYETESKKDRFDDDRSSVNSQSRYRKSHRTTKKQNPSFSGHMLAPHQLSQKSNNGSRVRYEDQGQSILGDRSSHHKKIQFSHNSRTLNIDDSKYSKEANRSRSKTNSFVLTTRSKRIKQSEINQSSLEQESMKSQTARAHIDMLNKKVQEMQEKLRRIQSKQKQLEQQEKKFHAIQQQQQVEKKTIPIVANKIVEEPQIEKSEESSKHPSVLVPSQKKEKIPTQKSIKNSEKSHQKSNQSSNQSSKISKGITFKKNKLNLSSSIINYNFSNEPTPQDQQLKLIKEQEEIQKERILLKNCMESEIDDLKKMIRELKLERIKREALIGELEDRRKSHLSKFQEKTESENPRSIDNKPQNLYNSNNGASNEDKSSQMRQLTNSRVSSQYSSSLHHRNAGFIIKTSNNFFKANKPKKHSQNTVKDQSCASQSQRTDSQAKFITFNPEQGDKLSQSKQCSRISVTLPTRKGIIIRQIQKRRQIFSQSQVDECIQVQNAEQSSEKAESNKNYEVIPIQQYKRFQEEHIMPPYLSIPNIQIPEQFPIPNSLLKAPLPSQPQKQLIQRAKDVFLQFGIELQCNQGALSTKISMKKYKNCVIFNVVDEERTLVWHYSGKFYFGGWIEETAITREEGQTNQKYDINKSVKHGNGFEYIPGKHYYRGEFFSGKKQGKGKLINEHGDIFEGIWQSGEKNGFGVFYEKSSGCQYEGEWKNNKREGKGTLKMSDREFYIGEFKQNLKEGFGTQLFSNGDIYEGQYKAGIFGGKGKYFWAAGSSYDGQFVDGKRDGLGLWRSANQNGDCYEGHYKEDKKHGKGLYVWENGNKYQGQFKSDLKHGKGSIQYIDGRKIEGVWQYGKLSGIIQNKIQDATPIDKLKQSEQDESLAPSLKQNISNLKQIPYKATQISATLVQI